MAERNEKKKPDLVIFQDEKDLNEAEYDYEIIPVPNKNCRTCNGKGYISVQFDTDSGGQTQPCGCVKWMKQVVEKEKPPNERVKGEASENISEGQND